MELLTNLRFALRQMRKRWVLTLAAALSLALCLGLNTAIFSVFNAALLRPLPFPEPNRIVEVFNTYPAGGLDKAGSGIELYTVYSSEVDAMEGFTLVQDRSFTVGGAAGARRVRGMAVSPDFFSTLHLAPTLGQPFNPEHGKLGNERVVMLTHGFWQSAFGGDPEVVGTTMQIDGREHTILGVLPRHFQRYAADPQLIIPWAWEPAEVDLDRRHLNYAMLLGRLKRDARIEQAQAQVDAIDKIYYETHPDMTGFLDRTAHRSRVKVHQDERVASIRGTVYLLEVFALAILVIGALNIANLRMAEVASRERELTLRRVLGAGRGALVRQLLTEAGLLGVLSGGLALLTAWLSLGLIRKGFAGLIRDTASITLDGTVLVGATALVLLTILIVGLYPTRLLWRLHHQTLLQEGGRSAASGRGAALRSSLGVVQTALAVLLLIATGLFVRSFWNATGVDPGFDAELVHTFRLSLPDTRYPEASDRIAMVQRVLEGLRAIPGVESAAGSTAVPVVTGASFLTFSTFGEVLSADQEQKASDNFQITEGFFETMGIRLLAGRGIRKTDTDEQPEAFIVDQNLADRYLDGEPLRARMTFGQAPEKDEAWPSIVGLARPIVLRALTDLSKPPLVYRSYYSNPRSNLSFLLRSPREHGSLVADARRVVEDIDPQLPLYLTGRLDRLIEDSLQERRGILGLTLLFGGVALLLAMAGIYGVQAYNIQAQHRNIAIRAALGATPAQLLRRTLSRSLLPVGLGLLIGLAIGLVLTPRAGELLFSVDPRDPLTFSLVAIFVLLVSGTALFVPARLASRRNPAKILHEA